MDRKLNWLKTFGYSSVDEVPEDMQWLRDADCEKCKRNKYCGNRKHIPEFHPNNKPGETAEVIFAHDEPDCAIVHFNKREEIRRQQENLRKMLEQIKKDAPNAKIEFKKPEN